MKYLTGLLFLSVMVIAGCGDTPDSQLINDAHESVKKRVGKKVQAWRVPKMAVYGKFRRHQGWSLKVGM